MYSQKDTFMWDNRWSRRQKVRRRSNATSTLPNHPYLRQPIHTPYEI